MLVPALLYKEELEKLFAEHMYDDDMYLYTGYRYCFSIPNLEASDYHYRYAIIDSGGKVIGYFDYRIDDTCDTANNFGLFSFSKGNSTIGRDVFMKMEELVKTHRRVEWRMLGGNPVERSYDRFIKEHGGNKVVLHDVTKNQKGKYVDDIIYEIVRSEIP